MASPVDDPAASAGPAPGARWAREARSGPWANSVRSRLPVRWASSARGRSRTRIAIVAAATNELIAPNTKMNATPPKNAEPRPPIAGPRSNPPIWAAPYIPNASPRRSAGVASVM